MTTPRVIVSNPGVLHFKKENAQKSPLLRSILHGTKDFFCCVCGLPPRPHSRLSPKLSRAYPMRNCHVATTLLVQVAVLWEPIPRTVGVWWSQRVSVDTNTIGAKMKCVSTCRHPQDAGTRHYPSPPSTQLKTPLQNAGCQGCYCAARFAASFASCVGGGWMIVI